eukprot:1909-Amphidinium_carterae.1
MAAVVYREQRPTVQEQVKKEPNPIMASYHCAGMTRRLPQVCHTTSMQAHLDESLQELSVGNRTSQANFAFMHFMQGTDADSQPELWGHTGHLEHHQSARGSRLGIAECSLWRLPVGHAWQLPSSTLVSLNTCFTSHLHLIHA